MRTPDRPEAETWHVQVMTWVMSFCKGFRRSQRKTLGELVFGALRCRRVSEADLGRAMATGTTVKHNIKRVWRFLRNADIEVSEGAQAMLLLVARRSSGRVLVAVDWVKVGSFDVLRAAVPFRGRSVPLLFAAYRHGTLFRSQNALEEGFFVLLSSLRPAHTELVVIADRGFARADLARRLDTLKLSYVIRVCGKVRFDGPTYQGLLEDLEACPGEHQDLGWGKYRDEAPVDRRLVVYWGRGQLESLLLATNTKLAWRQVVKVFRTRMMIEELFRDEKNLRYGWGLRCVALSEPGRLERLLLVLVLAYLLLLLLGLWCERHYPPSCWCSTTSRKRRQTSAFLVGRLMLPHVSVSLTALLRLFRPALRLTLRGNWG